MKRKHYLNLLLSICSLVACLLAAELGVRYWGTFDADGNFIIGAQRLKPYRLPVLTTQDKVDSYLAAADYAFLIYDPQLGWRPRPNGHSQDGLFHYNALGLRAAPTADAPHSPPDVLQVALFGDSFTHGDEVSFAQTWGVYLEQTLKANGRTSEVLNFGVGGYGLDQAYLRWQAEQDEFSPQLVILGLQLENVKRNLNLIRPIYFHQSKVPFSKPRFLLRDERLELLNVPTVPPQEVPSLIKNLESWPLADAEYFYSSALYRPAYQDHLWLKSKLIALAAAVVASNDAAEQVFYDPAGEGGTLTLRIIEAFAAEVEASGANFVIVYLPQQSELTALAGGETFPGAALLAEIDQRFAVVHPEAALLKQREAVGSDALFLQFGHYSAEANQLIAEAIAAYIIKAEPALGP